ncbi:MAG: FAD-dependent monooxygenase [Cyanobacteria bacterium]|nr:FAD-dependent monooxygenase [Cyanobacteriota bacterium]
MDDVAIAGAGPAGALAAAILARAGLRVSVFDRARFPRHKLCGDTLNPGALAVIQRHADVASLMTNSDPIDGMLLTGPGGVRVRGEYGGGVAGRSITRRVLDLWLVDRAVAAGATLHEQTAVRDVVIEGGRVAGLVANGFRHRARMVIAADGRRSAIAVGRGWSRQPQRPRRWAIGAYYSGVTGVTSLGEMHVRHGHYIGVAPVPGGLTNACLVVPHPPSRRRFGETGSPDVPFARPAEALENVLKRDPELSVRFASARAIEPPTMLGPMAVDTNAVGEPGLLLAGDAAGFIDPMTGDGLRFALMGAELAAHVVIEVLNGKLPIDRGHRELTNRRREAFQSKWRFNRALRSLVSSPSSVNVAAATARVWPSLFQKVIQYAGDCGPAKAGPSQVLLDESRI